MNEASLVGKRQEILDDIFNIEAEATPVLSLLKSSGAPNQMLMTWVAEVYPEVASTGVIDGTAASSPTKVDRYLLEGCAQHFRREWGVTTLANLTNVAGTGRNEAGHQKAVAMLLLKRMMEQQILSADDCAVETRSTPWTTRGMFSWLQNGAQSVKPVPSAIRPASANSYTGAIASFTEDSMITMLKSMFSEKKSMLELVGIVGPTLKTYIDNWTCVYPAASTSSQARGIWQNKDPKVFAKVVNQVQTSFGTVDLLVSSFLAVDTATGAATSYSPLSGVFIDPSLWDIAYPMKPANTNLAPDGSGVKGFIDAVVGLRCKNPRGQGRVYTNT